VGRHFAYRELFPSLGDSECAGQDGLPSTRARSQVLGSHLDVLSPFRPCGRLVEFLNSTGWAFSVNLTAPCRTFRFVRHTLAICHANLEADLVSYDW
jgi:hypothetical protein